MSVKFEEALERFDIAAQEYAFRGSMETARTREVEREYEDAKHNLRMKRKL
jgi:hypothetical protein